MLPTKKLKVILYFVLRVSLDVSQNNVYKKCLIQTDSCFVSVSVFNILARSLPLVCVYNITI